MNEDLQAVALWIPPAGEHTAWQEYTGNTMLSKTEFDDRMTAIISELQSQNITVIKVNWTVFRMRDELAAAGLSNTTEHRAAVIAGYTGEDDED
jgi:hypothetical protein